MKNINPQRYKNDDKYEHHNQKKILMASLISLSLLVACAPVESKKSQVPLTIVSKNGITTSNNQDKNDRKIDFEKKLTYKDIEKLVSLDNLNQNLKELTSTHRKRGTKENYLAGDYISSKMKENGYDVYFQEFDGYEEKASNALKAVSKEKIKPSEKKPIFKGRNIIAKRKDFNPSTPFLVISAHYDTTTDNIGAIDNGAAVCALIEVSRILEKADLDYEPVFVFFDSEEYRRFGSRFYIYNLSDKEKANIYGNFNVDMIGNSKARKLMIVDGSNDEFYNKALKIFPNKNIEKSELGQSDDSSFYYNHIKNARYTTADFRNSDFKKEWLSKEVDASSVDLNSLLEDVDFIAKYLNEFELDL